MPNNLTGDYDAVLEVNVRQINGLLATLHQNRQFKDKSPSFPHSVIMRVGPQPKIVTQQVQQFTQWLGGVKSQRAIAEVKTVGTYVVEKAPPGVAGKLKATLEDYRSALAEVLAGDPVHGEARIQISVPQISLLRGMDLMLHVFVRAHYFPDPGSTALPPLIHGEVQIVYRITPVTLSTGKNALRVLTPSDDTAIQFLPVNVGGLSSADQEQIAAEIRKVLRQKFTAEDVALPDDFTFFDFTAVSLGSEQAVAIPFQLSGTPVSGGIGSVTNFFLDSDEFAIAVSKEYVRTQFQPTLDKLKEFKKTIVVPVPVWWDPTYHFSVKSVDLQFKAGSIDLLIYAQATTNAAGFVSYNNIVITQNLTLLLVGEEVTIQGLDSGLTIAGLGMGTPYAKAAIVAERDKALPQAEKPLREALQKGLAQLKKALLSFDDSGSASFTAVDVKPDGIVVRGAIETKWHIAPIIRVGEAKNGKAFSALETWIPGGRITKHIWSWVETPVFTTPAGIPWIIPWWGKTEYRTQPDEFILDKPAVLQDRPSWSTGLCLAIEGTQVDWNGNTVPINVGETCHASSFEKILVVPSWLAKILAPIWLGYPAPVQAPLEESISAHVNLLADQPEGSGLTTNSLVHFISPRAEQPLQLLSRAIGQARNRDFPLALFVVFPEGTFRGRREEIDGMLGVAQQQFEAESRSGNRATLPLTITEDYAGGWTRAFGVESAPSTFLINARGEFVWKQDGPPELERLVAALNEHLLFAPSTQPRLMRLTVQPGERAPDASFVTDRGERFALRRLRGRPVLLNFWQSWSAPCLKELRLLQQLAARDPRHAPVIVALNGDDDAKGCAVVRERDNPSILLVHDADQQIARRYGIQCWPTTVSINPDGIVDRIQFGMSHAPRAGGHGEKAT